MCLVDFRYSYRAAGYPGITRRESPKSVLFSHRFFHGFLMVFALILDDFFDDFPMFFASLFRHLFFMFFWSFPNRFLNRANHEIIKNPLVFIGLFALGTFRTLPIFQRISIQKTSKFRMDFSWNSWLFRHRFSHRFFHWFFMDFGPKWLPKSLPGVPPFRILFASFSRPCLLCWFYVDFGHHLAHFWLQFAPFWHPLVPVWHTFSTSNFVIIDFGTHFWHNCGSNFL